MKPPRPGPCAYLLQCRDGSLYAGAAMDLARRLKEHDAGRASRYTRSRRPLTLVWVRRVRSWGRALRLELQVKSLSRAEKLELIEGRRRLPARAQPASQRIL